MMEESISSSPQKSQRSIHAARMHRKNRCRRVNKDDTMKSICTNESDAITMTVSTDSDADLEPKPKLADLYWEETKPADVLNTTFLIQQPQNTDFDPFQDEMLLTVADSLDRHRKQLPRQSKKRQGFIKCSQLMEESIKEPTPPPMIEYNAPLTEKSTPPPMIEYSAPLTEKSTHFDITESELLQCCANAENDMDTINETVPSTTVHKSHKSIVESILEDFCNSQDSFESEEAHSSNDNSANKQESLLSTSSTEEDRTPVFKFKSQSLRTYSHRSVTVAARANIAERLESVASAITDAGDDGRSCSSVSSVQKDLIELTEPDLESTYLNKSGNVCENLLNLSVHFSQKSTSSNTSPRIESAKISDSTPKRNKEINDKLLEVSEVMAQNFNSQLPVREEQLSRDKLDQTLAEKDINALSKDKAAEKEEEIFNESEEENYWNDECNFFKNFNTQDIFRKDFSSSEQSAVDRAKNENEFQGFTTASNKSITISEKAKQRAAQMIAEIDAELENDFKATQNFCVFSQTRKNVATNRVSEFHSVQTAANKENIENVVLNHQDDAATELGNIQFSEWLIDDCDDNNLGSEHIQIPEVAEMGDFKLPVKIRDTANMSNAAQRPPEEPFPAFIGFLTASQKPIEISAEAKAKAAKILETLPDFPKGIPGELAEAECTLQGENMCEKYEELPTTTKRKLEHAEKYLEQIPEQAAKVVCKSNTTDVISPRTPLATCSYNGPVATTSFSAVTLKEDPALSSVKKSIISRRNLLTLNRKKRIRTKEKSEENLTSTSTPLKTTLPEIQMPGTPGTPNVNAFFAAVPDASTPHAVHADGMQTLGNVKQTSVSENLNEMDADFQQIEWGVCNDTSTSNKTEMSSASSSTLVEMETTGNPSPKIRIDRLCKYGDPPQVSPILMTIKNNCRPSGLRRFRGMNKRK